MSKTFKDLKFKSNPIWLGKDCKMFFPNGYGVSVISHLASYGGDRGLWEVAVLRGKTKDYVIDYDTPVTNDVLGCLTARSVTRCMKLVQAL